MRKNRKYWFPKPYKQTWRDDITKHFGGSIFEWMQYRHPFATYLLKIVSGGLTIAMLLGIALVG